MGIGNSIERITLGGTPQTVVLGIPFGAKAVTYAACTIYSGTSSAVQYCRLYLRDELVDQDIDLESGWMSVVGTAGLIDISVDSVQWNGHIALNPDRNYSLQAACTNNALVSFDVKLQGAWIQ